jgi:ATP-dependent Clp protease ATP-binding subunit ClpA
MMFNRFVKDARNVVGDASDVARENGSTTTEAEHLLLAVARADSPAARVLAEHGLDYEGLLAALERETERSLAAVGVAAEAGRFSPWVSGPNFGTSAKRALERALRAAEARGDRRITSQHIALGVLKADVGTVPRALQIAEVDRRALTDEISATLS